MFKYVFFVPLWIVTLAWMLPGLHAHAQVPTKTWQPVNTTLLEDALPMDVVYGDPAAPVKVVEYASLSCHHCKNFHLETLKPLKKQYIANGSVYFVYRHFPLNLSALRAAQLVECSKEHDKAHAFLDALFTTQKNWAYQRTEAEVLAQLRTIAKIGGITGEAFDQCVGDSAAEEVLLQQQVRASKELNINSTPSLFIQGKPFTQRKTLITVQKAIDEALEEAGAAVPGLVAPDAAAEEAAKAPVDKEKE